MAKIQQVEVLPGLRLRLHFADGAVRLFEGTALIGRHSTLTDPLYDPAYFAQVALYPDGYGIFWPNTFDMCPDWLRHYAPAIEESGTPQPAATITR